MKKDSGFRVQGSGFRVRGPGFGTESSGFRVQGLEKMNFEHRTPNVERRMAKPHTHGLGPIGSSALDVERWTLKRVQGSFFIFYLSLLMLLSGCTKKGDEGGRHLRRIGRRLCLYRIIRCSIMSSV